MTELVTAWISWCGGVVVTLTVVMWLSGSRRSSFAFALMALVLALWQLWRLFG